MVSYSRQVRKGGRQFEKDRKAFFNECKANHRPCWLCGMPIDYDAPQNTTEDPATPIGTLSRQWIKTA